MAANADTRWMVLAVRPSACSFGAMIGSATSWPVDEPPVSMHMSATTTQQMRIGAMLMLVMAVIMDWNASVLVMTPAKPQIAATVIVMGTESTAPLLSMPLRSLRRSCGQNSTRDSAMEHSRQMLMLSFQMLNSRKRTTIGMRATISFGLLPVLS